MTSLYNCKHDGDQFRITKFDSDFNVESSYLCDLHSCECPAGVRPSCRHRQMLPKFIHRNHIGDEFFFDFDRGGWVQGSGIKEPASVSEALPIQQEQPATSNQELWLEQNEVSMRDEIADSLAPAGLGQASEQKYNENTPVFLPPSLYDEAEAQGHDMRSYRRQELIPIEPSPPSPSPTIRRRV